MVISRTLTSFLSPLWLLIHLIWYQSSSYEEFCYTLNSTSSSFFLILFIMNEIKPNMESYMYLHPSENPAVALVSPALDSSNYHSWSRSMITALSAKNKVEFVNGNAPEPLKIDRTYGAWSRCNNMVVSWIVHSVSISIRQSII